MTTVSPVRHGEREIGAYVDGRFVPVVDVTTVALAALAAAAVAGAGLSAGLALRRRPAIGTVTMGPGGWISLKRTARPPLRAASAARPWWAHLLRAHRLVEERADQLGRRGRRLFRRLHGNGPLEVDSDGLRVGVIPDDIDGYVSADALADVVRDHGLGATYTPGAPASLAAAVAEVAARYPEVLAAVAAARPGLAWEHDAAQLVTAYAALPVRPAAGVG